MAIERTADEEQNIWDREVPVEKNAYNWNEAPIVLESTKRLAKGRPIAVDLFCGCGGFSEGFRQAGFESALSVDIHRPSVDTFRHNHPTANVVLGDMRRMTDHQLEAAVGATTVDVVTAGVPCQGFSLNNRKRWDQDDRNFLFKEFIRVVNLLQPKVVVLENVSGLAMAANGTFKRAIAQAIHDSGYEVDFDMLNAAEHGVPQRRQRVFFIGVKPGLDIRWPLPTNGPGCARFVSVWEAIGDLPQIGPSEVAKEYDRPPTTDFQRSMRGTWTELLNHATPSHPPETIAKIAATRPGDPIYPAFRQRIRLHPDQVSPTQVSGGIRSQFQFGHPTMPRGLTIRERCRIQSFPDHYYISGGLVQGRVQTGNAVPPLLARALALQIAGVLRGEPRPTSGFSRRTSQVELFT